MRKHRDEKQGLAHPPKQIFSHDVWLESDRPASLREAFPASVHWRTRRTAGLEGFVDGSQGPARPIPTYPFGSRTVDWYRHGGFDRKPTVVEDEGWGFRVSGCNREGSSGWMGATS